MFVRMHDLPRLHCTSYGTKVSGELCCLHRSHPRVRCSDHLFLQGKTALHPSVPLPLHCTYPRWTLPVHPWVPSSPRRGAFASPSPTPGVSEQRGAYTPPLWGVLGSTACVSLAPPPTSSLEVRDAAQRVLPQLYVRTRSRGGKRGRKEWGWTKGWRRDERMARANATGAAAADEGLGCTCRSAKGGFVGALDMEWDDRWDARGDEGRRNRSNDE